MSEISGKKMNCHKVDDTIIGDDMQLVEIELDPAETVVAGAGAMRISALRRWL